MQTRLSPTQLADPDIAEADAVLRRCVHCGFCLPACPTYSLLNDERDSPRGRIYLIKEMLETATPPSPTTVRHLDRCLSCLSCRTACPSGVDYMRLIDLARIQIKKSVRRPVRDQVMRWLAAHLFSRSRWFAAALMIGRAVRLSKIPLPPALRVLLDRIPVRRPVVRPVAPGCYPASGESLARVILAQSCVQPVLRPEIDRAALEILNRAGITVVVPSGGGCCGAIPHHLGRRQQARMLAAANIEAWQNSQADGPIDAVISTAGGCGVVMADYGHLLARHRNCSPHAAQWAGKVMDISSFLAGRGWPGLVFDRVSQPADGGDEAGLSRLPVVAYHAACALQHGQRVTDQPIEMLKKAGFTVRLPEDAHLCCGSAGTYSLFQPKIADTLGQKKAAALAACRADIVVSGNIGCLDHLAGQLDIPVLHTVELLNWASGGTPPVVLGDHADCYRHNSDLLSRTS